MSRENQETGLKGESIAEKWLTAHGWTILDRRFRSGHRDVDIIAARRGQASMRTVAFVEVKTRASLQFGGPLGAISWQKQRELYRSASIWIARHGSRSDEYRFDVIGVLLEPGRVRVKHVENAFMLPSRG